MTSGTKTGLPLAYSCKDLPKQNRHGQGLIARVEEHWVEERAVAGGHRAAWCLAGNLRRQNHLGACGLGQSGDSSVFHLSAKVQPRTAPALGLERELSMPCEAGQQFREGFLHSFSFSLLFTFFIHLFVFGVMAEQLASQVPGHS